MASPILASHNITPRASNCEAQTLGDVTFDCSGFQANPTKSDMAVGTHEIERGLGNLYARQFHVIDGINRNHVDAQQAAEVQRSFGGRRLPDHYQVKLRVVELLEQILDGAVCPELEP